MNKMMNLLIGAALLHAPMISAVKTGDRFIKHVAKRTKDNRPQHATGHVLSKELTAAMLLAKAERTQDCVPPVIHSLPNVQVIHCGEFNGITVIALEGHGVIDIEGLPPLDTGSDVDVPVVVGFKEETPLWITAGEQALVLKQLPMEHSVDDNCIVCLFVKESNERISYSFGEKTMVMPEASLDANLIMVKVDAESGHTMLMEAYPANLPKRLTLDDV